VDKLLLPTIGGCIQLTGKAVQGLDFNASMFPKQLAARGVDGDTLAAYPYRDDGRLVWAAIERWVRSYVEHCYASNDAVAADGELQAFVRQVGQYQAADAAGRAVGGGIKGVGEDGGQVATREYLVQMITQIVWNGSAQHAAVNFPQAGPMVYAPAFPLTLMKAMPAGRRCEEADYLAMLPHERPTRIQLFILELLGGVHHTKLGHYPGGPLDTSHFGPGALAALEKAFRQDLAGIESTIQDRNRTRLDYPYLLPSQIPQSINI
jgi:arachidonate 15-lipoxygenase